MFSCHILIDREQRPNDVYSQSQKYKVRVYLRVLDIGLGLVTQLRNQVFLILDT